MPKKNSSTLRTAEGHALYYEDASANIFVIGAGRYPTFKAKTPLITPLQDGDVVSFFKNNADLIDKDEVYKNAYERNAAPLLKGVFHTDGKTRNSFIANGKEITPFEKFFSFFDHNGYRIRIERHVVPQWIKS